MPLLVSVRLRLQTRGGIGEGEQVEHRTAIAEDAGGGLHLLRYRRSGIVIEPLFASEDPRVMAA